MKNHDYTDEQLDAVYDRMEYYRIMRDAGMECKKYVSDFETYYGLSEEDFNYIWECYENDVNPTGCRR